MEIPEFLPFGAAAASFLVAGGLVAWVSKQPAGTKEMMDISNAVKEGAAAFLKREMKIIIPVAIALTVIIGAFLQPSNGIAFAVGATLSAVAGIISLKITVKAAVRTANMSSNGLGKTFALAFRGGATVGLAVPAMALLAITGLYMIYPDPITIAGVGIGASLIALFIRIGGGIFTKAADMGADLVGKVEVNIPEDDPRNPATIADNVGDNVGDAAGMGSDIYESYIITVLAALLIAALIGAPNFFLYPLLIGSAGMIASIIGVVIVGSKNVKDVMKPLNRSFYVSAIIAIGLNFVFITQFIDESPVAYALFGSTVIGVILVPIIQKITNYYTSYKKNPVKEIADSAKWGYASLTLMGIIKGMQSTGPFMIALVVAIMLSYSLASSAAPEGEDPILYGIFGTALTAMAMLSLAGIVLSIDAFGPIADNAGGIVEMTKMGEENRKVTDEIDAVGNTTKAVTKGFAIASAALAALAMLQAFQFEAAHIFEDMVLDYSLTNPSIIVGLLIGGLIPFIITGQLINGVSRAAGKMVDEVRRQFKADPGILEGTSKPDYAKCVDIATVASIKELWKPAIIAITAPIILGVLLGPTAVAGLLMGAVITGILLAYHLANTGGAWDNAKKLIEMKGEKGSEIHKVSVVGDIIGDPYKDTAGPALNTVIKLLNTIAIVFVSAFVAILAI
ncbi:sodium-translocating pyrophosphatase [Marine Group I thaumarchaeote]|uniref:K(+)-insensitive pyrophosphate-energized proton pump n=1 Tax=Marine Group I thaumarchaeote TaxID=2511932 RepID=A0A7K4MUK0_9ARCH|nr:MAG: sodium-translocating pyrophosphatase [Nitrosopumilus sp. YT1]NMI82012.1 sodium-translocating pyrophosphatase [Candidatus Nitrosopumilus sp. MTA1]NWJ20229.1 sodium-translocating pyrophosphatase [Marine Group I thaumarchaeote]NWJ57140.1 sodium-translocating pyrophosphatase [Marine Group I thaumarchaeote]NWK01056.1 sodium-translocating pyrophosphatase [Marine Group I thaumarchaeote]